MTKRIVSIVLCLIMALGIVAPVVNATDDSTVIWDNVTFSDVNIDGTTVNSTTSVTSPTQLGSTASTETVATTAPDCDCGNEGKDVIIHADSCLLKKYYQGISKQTSLAIWGMWSDLPTDAREYILAYLSWTDNAKLQELENRLSTGAFAEDSITVDGTEITAVNVPEYGSLNVTAPSASAQTAVQNYVDSLGDSSATQLFMWDISIQTKSGQEWQPDGTTVDLELSVPGLSLHKYATVYVVHVDDEGNASKLPAQVTEDGKIAFETTGFSTFAAYTVDFDYEGVKFSIPGESSIYLSEVFEKLRIPHNVSEVTNVEFSDTSLVTVAQEGTDWLLTSVKSFTSDETLTVSLTDGSSFVIKVTDPVYAKMYLNLNKENPSVNNYTENQRLDDGDGRMTFKLSTTGEIATNETAGGGYINDYPLVVVGPGTLTIDLQNVDRYDNTSVTSSSKNALLWQLYQLKIIGGATVVIRLGGSFDGDETITIKGMKNYSMFDVVDGDLIIRCSNVDTLPTTVKDDGVTINPSYFAQQGTNWADNSTYIPVILDGSSITGKNTNTELGYCPIIDIRNSSGTAQNVFIEDVTFQNAKYRAIVCRANELSNLSIKDCVFTSSVQMNYSASEQGGAAIRINAWMNGIKTSDTQGTRVDITNFTVDNCKFDSLVANNDGGAIESYGRIASTSISNCQFLNCKAQQWDQSTGKTTEYAAHGGAIYFAGYMGKVLFDTVTFDGCSASEYGGAVCFRSHLNEKNNMSRYNDIIFQNCTFEDCKVEKQIATGDGGAKHGGAVSLAAQVNNLKFLGCTFTNCTSYVNGGALAIGSADNTNYGWQSYFEVSTGVEDTTYGTKNSDSYQWSASARITTIKNFEIGAYDGKQTTFTGCVAQGYLNGATTGDIYTGGNGGALSIADTSKIDNVKIADATFDACIATDGGSAVHFANCYIPTLEMISLTVKNCDFKKDDNGEYVSGDAGGTIRTIGQTTAKMTMTGCTFENNNTHHQGGGLYWNANNRSRGNCSAELYNCVFSGNTAETYGGGIYCESSMTISNCQFYGNSAGERGGAIAQQVYNSTAYSLTNDDKTELKLDSQTWMRDNTSYYGGGISIRVNATQSIPSTDSTTTHTIDFQLNGASVYQNSATYGGGISFITETYDDEAKQGQVDRFIKKIIIDGSTANATGNIFRNTATVDGGGIYIRSSKNTELQIKEGHISGNTASGNGGGIYMSGVNATCIVTGGIIGGSGNDSSGKPLSNTAVKGGGIALSGGARIEMSGGEISYNKATSTTATENRRGGGIWLDNGTSELYNSIVISEGTITRNTADDEGGGVHVGVCARFQLDGGSITYNSANLGGGVSIYEAWSSAMHSYAVINGGTVSYNTATDSGGAFFGHYYANITINDGTISNNTATNGSGGGIVNRYYGRLTVAGGVIELNHATQNNGGGIYLYDSPADITGGDIQKNDAKNGAGVWMNKNSLTITGGNILNNTASGDGGGIYAGNSARVTVGATVTTHGTISRNEASNGGGIYAVDGADVTITDGYLTYNKALGMPDASITTALHQCTALKGTGGGVFLASGKTADDLSTFTLQGSTYAIYGNLADFAADDVFSNGERTKLTVPTVASMDLSEYEFNPEGWFEDYPTDDTAYSSGLNLAASNSGIGDDEGEHVYRYRDADPLQRVLIPDDTGVTKVNTANTYVAMTLGMPTAVNDTVVIDYGKPVDIHVLTNEVMYVSTPTLIGIGPLFNHVEGVYGYEYDSDPAGYGTTHNTSFGTATADKENGVVRFSINTMSMNKEAAFSYVVKYTNSKDTKGNSEYFYYYADVIVIPATTIYYEDDFQIGTTSGIQYGVYDATTNDDLTSGGWTGAVNGYTDSTIQDEDRPGAALETAIDKDNVYGYDSNYTTGLKYSLGNAQKVTVDASKYATATFSFYGTGFDVISMTSADTGTIGVIISKYSDDGKSLSVVENYLVDTYYGYKFEDGKWVVDTTSTDTLYQVPVIKVNCKDGYGHYQVKIVATYADFFNHKGDGSYDFYLDAIRIYDPANDGTGNTVIQDAYTDDGEGWPSYQELRNKLISANTFDGLNSNGTNANKVTGVIFIDGASEVKNAKISDYKNFGPNNELYLAPGQAIAFYLEDPTGVAKIEIGMKTVGDVSTKETTGENLNDGDGKATVKIYSSDANGKTWNLETATDMYYDISSLKGSVVVVKNDGASGILSITNIKTTYTQKPQEVSVANLLTVTEEVGLTAIALLSADEEVEQPEQNVPGSDAEENPVTGDMAFETLMLTAVTACVMMLVVLALPKARKRDAK